MALLNFAWQFGSKSSNKLRFALPIHGFRRHLHTLNDIPGPKIFPIIGNIYLFGPLGRYSLENINDATMDLHQKYGSIVRLKIGLDMVFLFEPNDIEAVFRKEGKYPKRPLFEAILQYRKSNPDKYLRTGLVTDNGDGWYYLRGLVNPLLKSNVTDAYFSRQAEVAENFVEYMKKEMDSSGQIDDFLGHLFKYTQEAIGIVCFGTRLGCLDSNSNAGEGVNKCVAETLDAMGRTLLGVPIWKFFPTPAYKALVSSQNTLRRITDKLLLEAKQRVEASNEERRQNPFLSQLLERNDLDERDLGTVVLEIFSAGLDATPSTLAMTLYHLARNPVAQEKVISEINATLPKGSFITPDLLAQLKYLKACVKETMRLTPPVGGSARTLDSPIVLSGYELPAGTLVIGSHPVMSRRESLVTEADRFAPERWLREKDKRISIHPFVSLPFGFGARACPGKRIAEQEIMLLLVKKFRCTYDGGEVKLLMRLNFIPDRPLRFTFINQHN